MKRKSTKGSTKNGSSSTVAAFLQKMNSTELAEFAERCGTTFAYLKQLKGDYRQRRLGHQLARKFVENSRGQLTLHNVRPDIWV